MWTQTRPSLHKCTANEISSSASASDSAVFFACRKEVYSACVLDSYVMSRGSDPGPRQAETAANKGVVSCSRLLPAFKACEPAYDSTSPALVLIARRVLHSGTPEQHPEHLGFVVSASRCSAWLPRQAACCLLSAVAALSLRALSWQLASSSPDAA